MFYRFLYITWRIFWSSILVLVATVVLFFGIIFLMLQTNPAKMHLSDRAEYWFNTNFEGTLHIGEVGGFLPLQMELRDVVLEYEDRTIVSMETLRIRADIIALLRNNLTVNDLALIRPSVYLRRDETGMYTLKRALSRIPDDTFPGSASETGKFDLPQPFHTLNIYAPFMQVHQGLLHVETLPEGYENSGIPEPFRIGQINTEMFLEISTDQRYLDISYLTLLLEDLDSLELALSGQVYNDSRYLEFNVMRMRLGESYMDWNMEFDGIDLFGNNMLQQFEQATWTMLLKEGFLSENERNFFVPELPGDLGGLHATFLADGTGRYLSLRDVEIESGNTGLRFEADVSDFRNLEKLAYQFTIHEILVDFDDLVALTPQIQAIPFRDWNAIGTTGVLKGNADIMQVDLVFKLPEGSLRSSGMLDLTSPLSMDFTLTGQDINLAALDGFSDYPGRINTEILLTGSDLLGPSPYFTINVDIFDSWIAAIQIPDLHLDIDYSDKVITYEFGYYQGTGYINGHGSLNLRGELPHLLLRGASSGLDLGIIAEGYSLPESDWNMNYDINWHGRNMDEWHGRVIVDVHPSRLNGNDLKFHQLYLDLNHPESRTRSLRLTSSIADLVMEGEISIPSIAPLINHWQDYFAHRVNDDILFRNTEETVRHRAEPGDLLKADIFFEIKNLELLQAYVPRIPDITSSLQLQIHLHADHDKLEISSEWEDVTTAWNGVSIENSDVLFAAGFRFDQPFREFLELDMEVYVGRLTYMDQNLDSLSWTLFVDKDAISSHSRIANFGNEVRFSADIRGGLSESEIHFVIDDLVLGNYRYLWMTDGHPVLRYEENGKLHVEDLLVISGDDRIFVDGSFSSDPEDSVVYRFVNVDLGRISRMIDGKVGFQGIVNGDFVTRNLAVNPVFHGMLNVERLAFNERIIGDASLVSTYNSVRERFDTELQVITDEDKYSDYIEKNNGIRQHVTVTGWLRAPEANASVDSLYYFDFDVVELDAWVLRYLLESVFESIEGKATGKGYITGNLTDFDFHGDFEILESRVVPAFLEPLYRLTGKLSVNRQDGVIFHELNVRDAANGRGVITGTFDFNDFQPEKFMDITLRMQNLRFLDNSQGPDVPLYGRLAGTGVVNISGSNISPFVRTIEPVYTTSQSRLSLPLGDQAMDEAQGRYIRFVKDFGEIDFRRKITTDPSELRQIDRTFMEVFRLDLQFVAAPNTTVQLIFDPVTGEIVNAQGSGRVRITLENEDLQVFGNFDISSGDYLFVGGDILTRRFILREGGTIRLEGDPANSLLDITAVYRSRPNIAPLLGGAMDQTNRVPVELLLVITGTIDNLENDFYFEFPNAIDATQNAAVLNVLNSEEQKLLQATSLLFTGGFISGAIVGDTQTQELGTSLQARAGQVGISQLLSNQINTLLSDNLINLDVDLNLLGFDQADLGIALRLFDDRLVLRREGEVGGEETNIGDLGATYRINQNLSVEVFHRKDPMLMSILGAQADVENVNGVGLEAQFRFNTWKEFGNRVWRNVTTVFGLFGSNGESQAERDADPDENTIDDIKDADNIADVPVHPAFTGIREDSSYAESTENLLNPKALPND